MRSTMAVSDGWEVLGAICEKIGNKPDALVSYKKIFGVDAAYRDVAQKIQQLG